MAGQREKRHGAGEPGDCHLRRLGTVGACLEFIQSARGYSRVDEAEASLQMALDVAAAQSAKGAQLHAANSLARLCRDQG